MSRVGRSPEPRLCGYTASLALINGRNSTWGGGGRWRASPQKWRGWVLLNEPAALTRKRRMSCWTPTPRPPRCVPPARNPRPNLPFSTLKSPPKSPKYPFFFILFVFSQRSQKRSNSSPETPRPKRAPSSRSPYALFSPDAFSPR